jgi:hypothetical protein
VINLSKFAQAVLNSCVQRLKKLTMHVVHYCGTFIAPDDRPVTPVRSGWATPFAQLNNLTDRWSTAVDFGTALVTHQISVKTIHESSGLPKGTAPRPRATSS